MTQSKDETILAQERLHWGIFLIPLIAVFALLVATLPVIALARFMQTSFQQFQPHASSPIGNRIIFLFLLPEIVIALGLLLVTWLSYSKSTITLTDRRLIFRTGLLARVTGELPLQNVEAIFLREPIVGRMLGFGTVTVTSVGGLRFPLQFISSPQKFHAAIQRAIAATKSPARPTNKMTTTPPDDDSRYMPKM